MTMSTPRNAAPYHRLATGTWSGKKYDQGNNATVTTEPAVNNNEEEDFDDGPYDDGGPMYFDDDGDNDNGNDNDNGGDYGDKAMVVPTEPRSDAPPSQPPPAMEKHGNVETAASYKTPARLHPGEYVVTDITPSTAVPVAGWQRLYDAEFEDEENQDCNEASTGSDANETWVDDGTLPVEPDSQNLPFYLLDAHEESAHPGVVYLFGKIPAGENSKSYVSCCAIVKGLSRTLFFVPKDAISSPEISELHTAAQENESPETKKALLSALHSAFASVKSEVRGILTKHGITQMTMKPVLRQYAFENQKVMHGKQWVLKVRYPAALPVLPLGLSGDTFSAVFGTNQSCLEALILKRRIMGPSWIAINRPRRIDPGAQVSYCRVEVEVQGHKSVANASSLDHGSRPAPPLTVAAVHLKTVINPNTAANEVVAASVVYLPRVETDGPASFRGNDLRHFSAVRKLDGVPFPIGFDNEVKKANASDTGRKNGGAMLAMQPNERALLTMLVVRLKELDADVYVGHNFAAYDLDVLLHRMQALKVPHWASLGRLKRSKFPSLGGGGHVYGGGAGLGQLSVVAGRLLCDTYLAARDLVRETDYTLTTLSKNLIGEIRSELSASDVPGKFQSVPKLLELIRHTESDAWLSLRLAFFLAVLPLTRQLAELSGSLWSKALMNQRAQRIEYLLLHEFHNNKFLLPDKLSMREKDKLANKDKAAKKKDAFQEDGEEHDDDGQLEPKQGGKRGGPQYAGGLVLEPKKGLYERYVLLLDFNSLYPSIIQEYNICFTTVVRPEGGGIPSLPEPSEERAPLPRVIGALVQRRRRVKDMIKTEKDAVKKEQLNIRQQALKLLANSMYGCLGFSQSRFYARPLAELITSQGREILQSTVDLVQGSLGREVIYGDTDSIMINTDSESLQDVIALGQAIKKEVNKRYRLLEIEMDGIFRCILLLKKKKYAAIKIERGSDGNQLEVMEAKGLDMVRRDWCPLAKQASQFVLDRILSCQPREEVIAAILEHLTTLAAAIRDGQIPLNKFVITKQLTKRPEDYPDAKNQPHVQVALRRRAAGKRDGVLPGETVPYVIGIQPKAGSDTTSDAHHQSLADRAFSPDELSAQGSTISIDADYYISQQIFPVVSRLVAPIQGTDAAQIAESLGMDPSKFRGAGGAGYGNGGEIALAAAAVGLDEDDRFTSCTPLYLTNKAGEKFAFKGVRALLQEGGDAANALSSLSSEPLTPAQVANQVVLRMRETISKYYEGRLRSDDETMPCRTRNVCLRVDSGHDESGQDRVGLGTSPPDPRCNGTMHQEITEAQLYTQLSYYHRLFDVEGALHALGDNKDAKVAAETVLSPIRRQLEAGAQAAKRFRDRSSYRWINLGSIFGRASSARAS